jgi:hypothetical protein
MELRERCLSAAAARHNWEAEAKNLVALYTRLGRGQGTAADREG